MAEQYYKLVFCLHKTIRFVSGYNRGYILR